MPEIWKDIITIVILIILNSILSLSEAAMLAVRKTKLQQRLNEGNLKAGVAIKLAENPNQFLSAIQIGITVIDVLVGAISGATIAYMLGSLFSGIPALKTYSETIGLTIAVIVVSYLSIVFGELVPKRIALQNSDRVAMAIARPMNFITKLFTPFVWVLSKSTEFILHIFGVKDTGEVTVTEEELLVQLDQGPQAGVFEATEQDMVEGVFSLSDQRSSR